MSEAPKPATPSQHQLRAKLEEMVIRDLLGPMEGDDEVAERSVRERYLVGILAPSRKSPDDQSTAPFYDERFATEQIVSLRRPLSRPQREALVTIRVSNSCARTLTRNESVPQYTQDVDANALLYEWSRACRWIGNEGNR